MTGFSAVWFMQACWGEAGRREQGREEEPLSGPIIPALLPNGAQISLSHLTSSKQSAAPTPAPRMHLHIKGHQEAVEGERQFWSKMVWAITPAFPLTRGTTWTQ